MSETAAPAPPPVVEAPPTIKVEGENLAETPAEDGFLASIEGAFSALNSPGEVLLYGDPAQGGVEETPAVEGEAKPVEGEAKPVEGEAKPDDAVEGEEKDPIDQLLDFEPTTDEGSGWTPKAAQAFQKSKGVIKTLQEELAEAKSRLGETSTRVNELEATGDNPDLDSMRSKLKEYEQREMVTSVEKSDSFKELITAPLTELVEQSDAIAERNSLDPEELLETLSMKDVNARKSALTELMSGADDEDRFKVYSIIEKMGPIFDRREAIMNNVEEAARELKDIESQKARQEAAQALENRTKAARAVGDRIKDRMTFLGEMEDVNLEGMVEEATKEDPGSLDPVKGTFNAISAKLLPKLAREIFKLNSERDDLLKQLSEYEEAEPGAGGGTTPAGVSASGADDGGFMDAINRSLGS